MFLVNKLVLVQVIKVVLGSLMFVTVLIIVGGFYLLGYTKGYNSAFDNFQTELAKLNDQRSTIISISVTPTSIKPGSISQKVRVTAWGGPQLWDAVNKRRSELGVNPLIERDEICTIASIRLNQLLDLGRLDAHVGFSEMPDKRSDLKWIFEKYSIAEFLAEGGDTPAETVSLWENTLGHKKLLTGGEYVWGCIYAQNTFAVAIAAY